jgi:hypothetical protein
MGADGGIQWIRLRKPAKYDRLMELIKPFHCTYWQNGSASGHDDDHWKAIQENDIGPPNHLIGVYGTDMGDIPSLDDLFEIISSIRDIEGLKELGIDPNVHSFLNLIEEKATRPNYWCGFDAGIDQILKIMYDFDNGESIRNEPIYKMTLAEWADEIESIIGSNEMIRMDTWT